MSYEDIGSASPFFDDYDADKNFLRILFQPGRAVQARELTQAQTILQNQVTTLSDHLFSDGAMIVGSKVNANSSKLVLQLGDLDNAGEPVPTEDFLGRTIKGVATSAVGKVTSVNISDNYLYVDTLSGEFGAGERIDVIISNSDHAPSFPAYDAIVDATSYGVVANSEAGIIYLADHFVVVFEQETIVDPIQNDREYKIGYVYTEEIVNSIMDPTLLDPASGYSNHQAPGADRYRITAVLTSYIVGVDTRPENFIEIIHFADGENKKVVDKVQYADLMTMIERRTYDESGSYVVKKHNLKVEFDTEDESKLKYTITAGKTYVMGHEIETIAPTILYADKGRTTRFEQNESHYVAYGVYVDMDIEENTQGVFNTGSREYVYFMQSTDGVGNISDALVSTRILAVSEIGNTQRLWLEWQPSIIDLLGSTKSIRTGDGSAFVNILAVDPTKQPLDNGLVFELSNKEIKAIRANETSYTDTFLHTNLSVSGSTYTISAPDNDTEFYASAGIISLADASTGVIYEDGTDFSYSVVVGSPSTMTITQGGSMSGVTSIDVSVKRQRNITNERTKTLTTHIETITAGADTWIDLTHMDIYDITKVEQSELGADTWVEIDDYDYEEGATDTVYDVGQVTGITPNKDYKVEYRYFEHSGTGDYFSVNSYMKLPANITNDPNLYANILPYRSKDGKQAVSLRNCLDFRRKVTDLQTSGLPAPEQFILVDYDYYLPRLDKIFVDNKGSFGVAQGIPDVNPSMPTDIADSLSLFSVYIPSYTLHYSTPEVTEYDNMRYTMKDISSLETRIKNLEQYTADSLLEKSANDYTVVDTLGNNKYKNGIAV
ncbi:MAG: hypothetical protein DRQ62_15870, partial [Gammaproteobacteria bacterium]